MTRNSTGEHYDNDDDNPEPTPSWNKVPIDIVVRYLTKKGLFDINRRITYRPELVLDREVERNPRFNGKTRDFQYGELSDPMVRISLNTPTNLIVYAAGRDFSQPEELQRQQEEKQTPEEVAEQFRRGADVISKAMIELELPEIQVKAPYLDNAKLKALGFGEDDYLLNVSTIKAAEKVQGKYLNSEGLGPLRYNLENEAHGYAIRAMFPGIKSMDKITMYKRGLGFTFSLDDVSIAVLLTDPIDSKQTLYTDEARDALDVRRVANPLFFESYNAIMDFFRILKENIFNVHYKKIY